MALDRGVEKLSKELNKYLVTETDENAIHAEVIEAIKTLDDTLNVNRCTYYYLNLQKNRYEYISPNIYDISKMEQEDFKKGGLDAFLTRMHADDAKIVVNQVVPVLFEFWDDHWKKDDPRTLYTSFNYRICNKDDEYINLIDESTIRGFTKEGKPLWLLGAGYHNPEVNFKGVVLNVFYKDEKGRVEQVFSKKYTNSNLTSREIELLKLFHQGKTSKEVANAIHLSVYTVNTHRRNLMEKLEAKTIQEAIYQAVEIGII